MPDETRTVCFDTDLKIEAYRFEGVMQKFPNHFHDYYVVGFIEKGQRQLLCKEHEYVIQPGDILLFNPGDNHTCQQISEEPLDYRCINIQPEIMRKASSEIMGMDCLPVFTQNVLFRSDLATSLGELHQMLMEKETDFKKEELFLLLLEQLITEHSDTTPILIHEEPSLEIKAVCDYFEKNYANAISLDRLSALTGLNKYHLLHSFTKQKGISPGNRTNQSCEKILGAGRSTNRCGFSDGI
jgi:mannose-6-phosphate isomerase-like protein (cupin superfamily)